MLNNEKDVKKVMDGFDFITACENIVDVWDYVTPQLIEKCFHTAGFICSVPTAPEPEPESERNVWDNIWQILNVQVPFSEYATADYQVEMTERLQKLKLSREYKVTNILKRKKNKKMEKILT